MSDSKVIKIDINICEQALRNCKINHILNEHSLTFKIDEEI